MSGRVALQRPRQVGFPTKCLGGKAKDQGEAVTGHGALRGCARGESPQPGQGLSCLACRRLRPLLQVGSRTRRSRLMDLMQLECRIASGLASPLTWGWHSASGQASLALVLEDLVSVCPSVHGGP